MTTRAKLMRFLMLALLICSGAAQAATPDDPCPVTSASREWSATCFDTTKAGRQIKKEHRKKVVYGRKNHAAIVIAAPPELVAVNRVGKVVTLTKAHLADLDFEPAEGEVQRWEIARFGYKVKGPSGASGFKCGYYRTGRFQVVAAPVYDECDYFQKGRAKVCIGCVNSCESGDCHETDFVGGEALIINERNEILERFQLPTIPLCGHSETATTVAPGGAPLCRPQPADPFADIK